MRNNSLTAIATDILKEAMSENIVEPSDVVLNGAVKFLRSTTGISIPQPVYKYKLKQQKLVIYEADLEKELRTPILKSLFNSLSMRLGVRSIGIGGFEFIFDYSFMMADGVDEVQPLATIQYMNGKYTTIS